MPTNRIRRSLLLSKPVVRKAVLGSSTATALLILLGTAQAAGYDECILAHMAGARNDKAVASIQTACIHQAEAPLAPSVVKALKGGTLAGYNPPMGLFMTIENRTTFAVTRMELQVTKLETHRSEFYEINYFEPEGVSTGSTMVTNQEHPDLHRINAGDRVTFRVPIAEKADSYEDWSSKYIYSISKAWGYSTVGAKSKTN